MWFLGKNKHNAAALDAEQSYTIKQLTPAAQEQAPRVDLGAVNSVKVLGSGCAKCQALEAATREALAQLGLNVPVEHVTDFSHIATYGVMSTPALVVNEQVVVSGRVLSSPEIIALLREVQP